MGAYRLAVSCPECGENIIQSSYGMDFTLPEGVVSLDSFACETFKCKRCSTIVMTPDVESMYEYEKGEEDNESGDDSDAGEES